MNVELWSITPDAEAFIERCARVCHRSETNEETRTDFLRRVVIELGHESVIEHASATFLIEGVSRALTHQLVRHRLGSYSQESLRYVDPESGEDEVVFIGSPSIGDNHASKMIFEEAVREAMDAYRDLRAQGVKKEDARRVLPIATPTRIVVTMNFRQWRHVIKERALNPHAQWEISGAVQRVLFQLVAFSPTLFGDLLDQYQINREKLTRC